MCRTTGAGLSPPCAYRGIFEVSFAAIFTALAGAPGSAQGQCHVFAPLVFPRSDISQGGFSMAPVRIGVVGVGTFGINHLRCFQQMGYMGQAELVAACDVNEALVQQRAQEFGIQAYTDHREMLAKEQLDGITVVTPDPFHHDIVMAAAEAGVHVLCEKPLDVTTEGCREMIQACDQAGVLLMVDFHKRYDEYHLAMREKIQAGDLGQIQYGYAHMEDRIEVPRDWFPGWATKSSPAWFLGVHFYDLACFLLEPKA